MTDLSIEDIMSLIELEDEIMQRYIKNYLEYEDELQALKKSNLMINDLLNFKNDYEFVSVMKIIEEHKQSGQKFKWLNMAEDEDIILKVKDRLP